MKGRLIERMPRAGLLIVAAVLFLLSYVTSYYFTINPSVRYQEGLIENYIQKYQEDFEELTADSLLLLKLANDEESAEEFRRVEERKYGIFIYNRQPDRELVFWNTSQILPPDSLALREDGIYFDHLSNGYYVVIQRRMPIAATGQQVEAFALIPVISQYYLRTSYLSARFFHDPEADKKIAISDTPTSNPVNGLHGKVLFYLKRLAHTNTSATDLLTFVLRIAALIFLLTYLHFLAEQVARRWGSVKGIFFLAGVMLLCRLLLYQFPSLFSFRQLALFDPTIYAANRFNRSLGDLLINALFFCWGVLFAWFRLGPVRKVPYFLRGRWIWGSAAVGLFVLVFATFQLSGVVRSLVADSKISFQVTDFFSLDLYTVTGFIILALLSLAHYYLTRILMRFIFPAFEGRIYFIYFLVAAIGLIYLSLMPGTSTVLFQLPVLLWLIIYLLLVVQEDFIINRFRITVAGILFWAFVFSVSLAGIILQGNEQKEVRLRRSIAEKYDDLTNPASERILSIAISYLDNRFLVNNFPRFFNRVQNRYIRDSIISENFSGYSNKYDTRMYVFDAAYRPVNNRERQTYNELNTIFNTQSRPTGIPGLFYHETSFDRFTYITKREIRDSLRQLGTFFLVSTPRQFGDADPTLYPELFRPANQNDLESSPLYAHAIYRDKLLIRSSTKYPFAIRLTEAQIPASEFTLRTNGDFDELWYKASNRKVVVIAKQKDSLIESITLFSYLFCAFLIMVALLQLVAMVLRSLSDGKEMASFWQLNIRSQIHGTVIFISILSFLIIGVATISFFISRYNRNNIDRLSRTADIMMRQMQKQLVNLAVFDDQIRIYDTVSGDGLQRLVREVADVHNADVNIYNLDGDLMVSSHSEVYEKGILSAKMHPSAYYRLNRQRQVQHVQVENVSSLEYLSIYTIVRDAEGKEYAYLNVPYFTSQIDLKQEISNFLVTIINLNAFILLIAGVIALFITNRITRSFSLIGEKMRAITLGKTNEEIQWNRQDEIGDLVKQYNKMVRELGASAEALARSEREGAWREMARQVAHEIKNPLTPMKLSIQYLQKAISGNQPNVKELSSSVASTLIEQIDHLSKIAADFSQFANITNRRIELVDLHGVIGSLVELNRSNEKVQITWNKLRGSLVMKADKTQMNRLFTNLITNAVEASSEKESCLIYIEEHLDERLALITIRDNGEGIPAEMQSRIFMPNFTTKSSGTGLGLAMCKNIVEQADGRIWFETEVGKGTTFFVELPVIS